tara:strand:+ start:295149 stop:296006 length:858 start_codon:yes stop_codon:yes gene_type:complete
MMIVKKLSFIAIALFMIWGFQSCNTTEDSTTAKVQLKLIDAPGDYLEVNIEIVDIQYNSSEDEGGWTSFTPENGYPINVDLTSLIAGNSLLLTDQIVPIGMLNQIRLVLSDNNNVVIEGEVEDERITTPLDTPSAMQSGLKLKLDTELEAGFSYTFILDWDVQESIVEAGNSDKYNLKPVIRVSTEVNSGSLSGKVTGEVSGDDVEGAVPLNGVTVRIYAADETYISTTTTDENGDFIVQGLAEGTYKIQIERDGYDDYESSDSVAVTVGAVADVGTIALVVSAI